VYPDAEAVRRLDRVIASHLPADVVGGWPAALLAATVLAAVTFVLVDLPPTPRGDLGARSC